VQRTDVLSFLTENNPSPIALSSLAKVVTDHIVVEGTEALCPLPCGYRWSRGLATATHSTEIFTTLFRFVIVAAFDLERDACAKAIVTVPSHSI
jgi:hypothetical protein